MNDGQQLVDAALDLVSKAVAVGAIVGAMLLAAVAAVTVAVAIGHVAMGLVMVFGGG